MVTRDEIVDAVAAAPDDLATRLVLGDWLVEHGEPWGELILLQCRNEPAAAVRIAELVADPRWLGPLHSPRIQWVFRNGLPIAFAPAGVFRSRLSDHPTYRHDVHHLFEIQFHRDGKVREELWEETDQDPRTRADGTYTISPWSALRGHGTLGVRLSYFEPKNKRTPYRPINGVLSYGMLRGEDLIMSGALGIARLKLT